MRIGVQNSFSPKLLIYQALPCMKCTSYSYPLIKFLEPFDCAQKHKYSESNQREVIHVKNYKYETGLDQSKKSANNGVSFHKWQRYC